MFEGPSLAIISPYFLLYIVEDNIQKSFCIVKAQKLEKQEGIGTEEQCLVFILRSAVLLIHAVMWRGNLPSKTSPSSCSWLTVSLQVFLPKRPALTDSCSSSEYGGNVAN